MLMIVICSEVEKSEKTVVKFCSQGQRQLLLGGESSTTHVNDKDDLLIFILVIVIQ